MITAYLGEYDWVKMTPGAKDALHKLWGTVSEDTMQELIDLAYEAREGEESEESEEMTMTEDHVALALTYIQGGPEVVAEVRARATEVKNAVWAGVGVIAQDNGDHYVIKKIPGFVGANLMDAMARVQERKEEKEKEEEQSYSARGGCVGTKRK